MVTIRSGFNIGTSKDRGRVWKTVQIAATPPCRLRSPRIEALARTEIGDDVLQPNSNLRRQTLPKPAPIGDDGR
ncbi:hypothetical protein BTW08_06265 [Salinicola sp. MH3R3-1]|nr:hypothetical protein BTW08_06265 [Salinicola sp. MH3R3-1]